MLFFAPFVTAYAAYEMVQRRLVRRWRVWAALAIAAMAVALVTWPFGTSSEDMAADVEQLFEAQAAAR
jgi:drug/metabolite transporter (DMT)-like permease